MSGWTDITSQISAENFNGTVLSDGHLCVITVDAGNSGFDDNGDIISDGLPTGPVCYYQVYYNGFSSIVYVQVGDGALSIYDAAYLDAESFLDGYTIVYPVA